MSPVLLFRFTGANQVEWFAAQDYGHGSLADLARLAGAQRVVLAAPGELVMVTEIAAPKHKRAAWLKAIPYALEEGLAEDVEDLHFAIRLVGADRVAVAAIRHEILASWLSACTEAGITLSAVVPDFLLLPHTPGAWSVVLDESRALVRCGLQQGFATERECLSLMLQLALAGADEKPGELMFWGELSSVFSDSELAALACALHRQEAPLDVLSIMSYESGAVLDLLQGPYASNAEVSKWLRPWRGAAILLGLWLLVQVALLASEYWEMRQEQLALRMQIEQVYRDAVPDARRIVNPRAQLENRLREAQSNGGIAKEAFLELLYLGGPIVAEYEQITLRGLRYNNRQLDLDLEGSSLEIFDRLKQRLDTVPGLVASIRTTKREGKVESQVSLKMALQ